MKNAGLKALLCVALLFCGTATVHAQGIRPGAGPVSAPSTLSSTTYFDTSHGDETVRLVNPTSNPVLCAMIYVFDSDEELQECCGCPVSTNGFHSLSTKLNLTSNPAYSAFDQGEIEIVSSVPNVAGICDPGAGVNPTPTVLAWAVHEEALVESSSTVATSVKEFLSAGSTIDEVNLVTTLEPFCAILQGLPSGHGICTCREPG